MRRLLILMAASTLASVAQAEVYSWREGGTTRYSNVAPPWYSATEPSRIRTRVILNGILVDDTGLPGEQRDKLRAQRQKAEAWNTTRTVVPSASTMPTFAPAPIPPGPAEAGAAGKPPTLPSKGVLNPPDAPAKPPETGKAAPR